MAYFRGHGSYQPAAASARIHHGNQAFHLSHPAQLMHQSQSMLQRQPPHPSLVQPPYATHTTMSAVTQPTSHAVYSQRAIMANQGPMGHHVMASTSAPTNHMSHSYSGVKQGSHHYGSVRRHASVHHSPSSGPCNLADLHGILTTKSGFMQFPTRPIDEVFPNVFVGNESSARNVALLKRLNITHVLNTAQGPTGMHVHTNADTYKPFGIKFKGFAMDDVITFNISRHFDAAAEYIQKVLASGGRILVHCRAGASRSATIVLAFLMLRRGMTVQQALRAVRARREVYPNDGFLLHLIQLNERLYLPKRHLTFTLGRR